MQTFETRAVEQRYEILLSSTIHDPKRMALAVRRMIEARVDGVAILTFGMEEHLLQHLRFRNVPLVFVDVGPKAPHVSNIRVDYAEGIRQAVQHLAALRHERIGFVTGPPELRSAVARKVAFETSMREIGLAVRPGFIVEGDHRLEGGKLALQKLWTAATKPTALVCSNDMTAIGVMREAFDLGIQVPDHLSVIGFDDIRMAEFMTPPLTTVQMSQIGTGLAGIHCTYERSGAGDHFGRRDGIQSQDQARPAKIDDFPSFILEGRTKRCAARQAEKIVIPNAKLRGRKQRPSDG